MKYVSLYTLLKSHLYFLKLLFSFFVFTKKRLLKEPELFVKKHLQGMFVDADQAEQNLKMFV